MGRKRKHTIEEVVEACKGTGGIIVLVAKKLGCNRSTVARYAKKYKTIAAALEQADEGATDLAEAKSLQLINAGYWPAIRYRLGTKGKKRGYTEKQEIEHTGKDGGPVIVFAVSGIDLENDI